MIFLKVLSLFVWLHCWHIGSTTAFSVGRNPIFTAAAARTGLLSLSADTPSATEDKPAAATPELSESEQAVYNLFEKLHESNFDYRVIVVGTTGAILETTANLGPAFKVNASPKSGKNLLTMATLDQSFEFHLTLSQVGKMHLVEKTNPKGNTMRVLRFTTADDQSVCTLILSDSSDEAASFFQGLVEDYGSSVEF